MIKKILFYFGFIPISALEAHHCKCCSSTTLSIAKYYNKELLRRCRKKLSYNRIVFNKYPSTQRKKKYGTSKKK